MTRPNTLARSRALRLARWVPITAVLAETAVGSYWDLARIRYVREVFDHLGYPMYFATILGTAKVAALAAILTPGHPRTKEWAYAGLVFVYGGAAASHIAAGDGVDKWGGPMAFAAATLATRAWLPTGGAGFAAPVLGNRPQPA
ncbi:DoxX family protein [Nocardia cyriacigeorgica]|uniref:DoxX family protein n=1 Tax=Nocardia cyriacigeorgica TaxID=135487 RepID=UPI0018940880|nr:DoxX family protein [Nocardia cyriacigeorgica]MBF6437299.1 DoxX family protein [Nocardia cyriacigeorgica]MBF6452868.1 DoxX family protein [Nocardia cyriacigeorgica]MBF6476626.1 DoxX family protein [Nocardia cyriacigeorgica]MBF6550037.1 DoxX family protein [Nocardia cyriacigeorgica]